MTKREITKILNVVLPKVMDIVLNKFNLECILMKKYYYEEYDLLFIQAKGMNIRIRSEWNGLNNISVLQNYIDKDGFEQEGYAHTIYCNKECSIDAIVEEIITKIEDIISSDRFNNWDFYYSIGQRDRRDKIIGGRKYTIKNNNILIEENNFTNTDVTRLLDMYFNK